MRLPLFIRRLACLATNHVTRTVTQDLDDAVWDAEIVTWCTYCRTVTHHRHVVANTNTADDTIQPIIDLREEAHDEP